MSTAPPRATIERSSLSDAWVAALELLTANSIDEGSPLTVSFSQFDDAGFPVEIPEIRAKIDAIVKNPISVDITASTIFPLQNLQLMEARFERRVTVEELSEYYRRSIFPRLRSQNGRANTRGTYFLRMTNYGADPKTDEIGCNQLASLLIMWKRNLHLAHLALQIAIRDPNRDLTGNPRQMFPCLQQVSFAYDRTGGISVTGFYPSQYIVDRAYGNYLGLAHLGWFVARELGKRLVRVNCIAAHPLVGEVEKNRGKLRSIFGLPL